MLKKYFKSILLFLLALMAIFGILVFLSEYAKSYVRQSVKADILKSDSKEVTFEVPAGDFLAIEGEENKEDTDPIDSWIEIAEYYAGGNQEKEQLHLEGTISLPGIGIEEPIWRENTPLAMRYGVILLKNTGKLGKEGNAVIVGHRNNITHTIFDKLTRIRIGDKATLLLPDGKEQKYRVNGTYYCSPYELDQYVGSSKDYKVMITLITCAREKGDDWRFVVTLIPD